MAASCNSARPISSGDFKPKQEAYRAVFAAGSVSRKESHRCVLPAPQRPLRPSTWPLLFSRNWVRAFLLAFKFIPGSISSWCYQDELRIQAEIFDSGLMLRDKLFLF